MAQRIRHLTTNQGIPGSSPCNVEIYCLILSCTLYLIFTAINAHRILVAYVAQRIRHLITNKGIAGSSLSNVVIFRLIER